MRRATTSGCFAVKGNETLTDLHKLEFSWFILLYACSEDGQNNLHTSVYNAERCKAEQ